MAPMQIWRVFVIFIACPLLGGLPLIDWLTRSLSGQRLAQVGTGNVSVTAAFYHGGRLVGILAVLSEALKGIAAVLLARILFPNAPAWELVALIMMVLGRYALSQGAGTTNAVWGCILHDWQAAGLTLLVGGISFTLLRQRQLGRMTILLLFPLFLALLHPYHSARIAAAIALSGLLALIYRSIPDDLDLSTDQGQTETQQVFQLLKADSHSDFFSRRNFLTLDRALKADRVGQKAATLAQLRRQGYPVPPGWMLLPGDDPEPLLKLLQPSPQSPLIVRSSAIGEDSEHASAAGQYKTIANITSSASLEQAFFRCLTSYDNPVASQYRRDQGISGGAMAVLVQPQIQGVFSGVAFSRDPISRCGDAVVIEALPGSADRVVSGHFTPEHYQVSISDGVWERQSAPGTKPANWWLSPEVDLPVEGDGDVPPFLIRQVAFLARHVEAYYHGIPQDLEWTYDGTTLWLLQARPITTLLPIWTRKIAAEVIPGAIHPLTWSVNHPLTCGVWGDIFTVVLGRRVQGLDFNETATLHYSFAYFNATLLGNIFRRMGLPPESLDFLTRGTRFTRPPLRSTLQSLPGLVRLLRRELRLERDFQQDYQQHFSDALAQLARQPARTLPPSALLERIDLILGQLHRATYYSILAPLSAALRQTLFRIRDADLDTSQLPEVAALRSLQALAMATRHLLSKADLERLSPHRTTLFTSLAEQTDGETVLTQFQQIIDRYAFLSEAATNIAVPTWREDPRPARELFAQYLFTPPASDPASPPSTQKSKLWLPLVQSRVNLKGRVAYVYSQLLAELRWSFVALEQHWQQSGVLQQQGDIFFLKLGEIRSLVTGEEPILQQQLSERIAMRRSQLDQDRSISPVPSLVYGNAPPKLGDRLTVKPHVSSGRRLYGIGASPGYAEGQIKIIRHFQEIPATISRDTILVVPYTDAGWAPLLAQAGGLIAEVGGRLSHGAIVAREYGIPAVMDVAQATHLLQDGQWVNLDGQQGVIEVL